MSKNENAPDYKWFVQTFLLIVIILLLGITIGKLEDIKNYIKPRPIKPLSFQIDKDKPYGGRF